MLVISRRVSMCSSIKLMRYSSILLQMMSLTDGLPASSCSTKTQWLELTNSRISLSPDCLLDARTMLKMILLLLSLNGRTDTLMEQHSRWKKYANIILEKLVLAFKKRVFLLEVRRQL